MATIIKAPLPIPSKTAARGSTQHDAARIAEGKLARIGLKLEIFIISLKTLLK
jgi:hypothetical protein